MSGSGWSVYESLPYLGLRDCGQGSHVKESLEFVIENKFWLKVRRSFIFFFLKIF